MKEIRYRMEANCFYRFKNEMWKIAVYKRQVTSTVTRANHGLTVVRGRDASLYAEKIESKHRVFRNIQLFKMNFPPSKMKSHIRF